jgi:hypothetical protein
MIKHINWGKGIVIGMIVFMAYIVSMGVTMFRQPDDVDQHYYEKGLAFDTDYNKEAQVLADKAQPQITVSDKLLHIKFIAPAKGTLNFLRPADGKLDEHFNLQTDTNNETDISLVKVAKGRWQLVFNWESHGKKYLFTKEIFKP